ncbi:type I-E CRISPR-associated protein Cse2/CasB [Streptomyces sp. NPDC020141]|uniref:type I-E CRISPR-associated protein Cse2/CasB n=1 Tax=Streptomyces sp. NPDC020141 TaxID=3365065 RepID=UPI0037B70E62
MTAAEQPAPDEYARGALAPGRATTRCVKRLQPQYRKDVPSAVATLARLRRSVGRPVHDSPDSWGIDGLEDLVSVRSATPGRSRDEDRDLAEEKAVHLAVALWALHQQSVYDDDMHEFGWGLGRAVRGLALKKRDSESAGGVEQKAPLPDTKPDDELNETLRKRFARIGTSTTFDSLAIRLRELTLLLRAARVPLDYGLLADQLLQWQDDSRRAEVRRAWGRDFHSSAHRAKRPSAEAKGSIQNDDGHNSGE